MRTKPKSWWIAGFAAVGFWAAVYAGALLQADYSIAQAICDERVKGAPSFKVPPLYDEWIRQNERCAFSEVVSSTSGSFAAFAGQKFLLLLYPRMLLLFLFVGIPVFLIGSSVSAFVLKLLKCFVSKS